MPHLLANKEYILYFSFYQHDSKIIPFIYLQLYLPWSLGTCSIIAPTIITWSFVYRDSCCSCSCFFRCRKPYQEISSTCFSFSIEIVETFGNPLVSIIIETLNENTLQMGVKTILTIQLKQLAWNMAENYSCQQSKSNLNYNYLSNQIVRNRYAATYILDTCYI